MFFNYRFYLSFLFFCKGDITSPYWEGRCWYLTLSWTYYFEHFTGLFSDKPVKTNYFFVEMLWRWNLFSMLTVSLLLFVEEEEWSLFKWVMSWNNSVSKTLVLKRTRLWMNRVQRPIFYKSSCILRLYLLIILFLLISHRQNPSILVKVKYLFELWFKWRTFLKLFILWN